VWPRWRWSGCAGAWYGDDSGAWARLLNQLEADRAFGAQASRWVGLSCRRVAPLLGLSEHTRLTVVHETRRAPPSVRGLSFSRHDIRCRELVSALLAPLLRKLCADGERFCVTRARPTGRSARVPASRLMT
jgi:hypothetical protein